VWTEEARHGEFDVVAGSFEDLASKLGV